MRAPLLETGLILLLCLIGGGCGDDPGPNDSRDTCCGGVDEPDEEGLLKPGHPFVPDPTNRADYLVDFGSTAVGETARRAFLLENAGLASLRVSVGDLAAPFSIAERPTEIAAGGSAVLRVEFEPTKADTAEAIIGLSDGARRFSVRLHGTGAMPALECPGTSRLHMLRGSAALFDIRCTNTIDAGFRFEADATAPFHVLTGPMWVEPGGQVSVGVVAETRNIGGSAGTLVLAAPGTGVVAEVALELIVKEGPAIRCEDEAVDFGEVVVGMRVPQRRITCHNEGDTTAGPLEISSSDPAITATLLAEVVPPGESFEIEIGAAPPAAGRYAADVALSVEPGGGAVELHAIASAIALAPCDLTVLPDSTAGLDFFDVQTGSRAVRDIVLRNGGEACALGDFSILGAGDVWSSLATEQPNLMLDAWSELRIPVAFQPDRSGHFEASLTFRVSNPVDANRAVPLMGTAVDDCLVVPDETWLANNAPGCLMWTETITVRNDCAESVVFLGSTAHHTGSSMPGLQVLDQPATPTTLAPGQSFELKLAFVGSSGGALVHDGFTLAFEGRADRWLQAIAERWFRDRWQETFVVGAPTDTFVLQHPAAYGGTVDDLREDFEVNIDGALISPVFQGVQVWTYDDAQNAIVLNEYFLPEPGSMVEITYHPICR